MLNVQIHDGTDVREDMAGAEQSATFLEGLIEKEEAEVPRNRIMIGGFSQVRF
jgi:predicted esterase